MALDNDELFDVEFYLGANPDVAKAVTEGLWESAIEHFTDYGRFEKRDPSLLFQTQFYLDGNSDVAAELASSRLDYALKHFTKHGQYEQRDPSIFFNTKFYLDTNPDVAKAVAEGAIASAIQHFTLFGMFEGRNPSNLYNNQFYLDSNPDVKAAVTAGQFRSGFDHFMEFGFNEGRIGATRAKLAFSAAEFRVIEDGTPVVAVTIDRTDGNIGEVSATVSLSNGTATAPEDYNNTPIEVKFASGETQKTVLIPIVNDNLVEGNETINLTLGNPQNGATIGDRNTAVLRILDNDGSAVLARTAGTILSDDSIDVFLPPGGELTLEVTVTVPGDGSTPAAVSVSPSSFALKKAAKLASGDTSTPEITFAATAAPPQLPLDVFLLQDLSGSFDDDLPKLRELVPNLIPALKTRQPDTTFGFGSFIDKPIDPFGINGDYVYSLNQTQTTDSTQLEQQVDRITVLDEASGADSPEAQLEALLQIARRTVASNENGFRNGARHVVVVSTDASYHIEGDGVQANITLPNNGDTIIDPQEDYPNVEQVKQALIDADIVPVFAVTDDEDNIGIYNNLINQLGFGKVVQLQSDSGNLVDAITEGLGAVGSEINIFSVSDDFGYVKEISNPKITNVKPGEKETFTVKLKSDGTGGDDTLILRALGYGDTKINVISSKITTDLYPVNFDLKGLSLSGVGQPFTIDLGGFFKPDPLEIPLGDLLGKVKVGVEGGAELFGSPGTFDVAFPASFTVSYDKAVRPGTTAIINIDSKLGTQGNFKTSLGANARVGGRFFIDYEPPTSSKFTLLQLGGELKETDLLNFAGPVGKVLSELINLDVSLRGESSKIENNSFKVEDNAFNGIDIFKIFSIISNPKIISDKDAESDFEKDTKATKAQLGLNLNQKTSLEIKGFEVDYDGKENGNEAFIAPNGSGQLIIPIPNNTSLAQPYYLTVKPEFDILTEFGLNFKSEIELNLLEQLSEKVPFAKQLLDFSPDVIKDKVASFKWEFQLPPAPIVLPWIPKDKISVDIGNYSELLPTSINFNII